MIRNYLVTAFRNLFRNRANTTINVLGLTLGITCSLVLFLVVRHELSYNKHFEEGDSVYRVLTESRENGGVNTSASLQFPFIKAFQTEFPEIPATYIENDLSIPVFYLTQNGEQIRFEERSGNTAMVHPDYYKVFSHDWLSGNAATALAEVNSVVLTRKKAMKYFGSIDVVGQTIGFNDEAVLKVTGVIEDHPVATDLPIDILISIATHKDYIAERANAWGSISSSIKCFIKLPETMSQADFEARMVGFDEKYSNRAEPERYRRLLQPLADMHYATGMGNYGGRTISRSNLWSMSVLGVLLLVIACSNFINLNTALAMRRAKEVGVRKVLGGTRTQLFIQFIGETFLVTFAALLLSLGAAELTLIEVRQYLGYEVHLALLSDWTITAFLLVVFLLSVILSGLYPALVMASFKPIAAIRNKVGIEGKSKISLRNVLVGLQLMISQALIICTILVVRQMDHFYNSPLGLDKESVIEMSVPGEEVDKHQLFKNRVRQVPGVESLTLTSTGAISSSIWAGGFDIELDGEWQKTHSHVKFIDKDFLDTYGIDLLEGENIIENDSVYTFLVNERLLKKLRVENYADILGTRVNVWGNSGYVIGVVADYNTESLHSSIQSLIMTYGAGFERSALKFNTSDIESLLAGVGEVYNDIFTERDFEPHFLDETIANFYREEQQTSTLFQVAAGVAIFIGCIGMLGLISYMASRKTKEVGIRKVLGASVSSILVLFSKQFLVLTLLGFALAAPGAYYLMKQWLQNYEYRINIGVDTFALGLLFTVVLVVISVGYRAYHSAIANPAKSLRSE